MCDVQVQLWKNYIQWEKNNPLRTEDTTLITKRGERQQLCFDVQSSDFSDCAHFAEEHELTYAMALLVDNKSQTTCRCLVPLL